jgi:hypothetical protein
MVRGGDPPPPTFKNGGLSMKTKKVEVNGKNVEVRQFVMADIEELFSEGNESKATDIITDSIIGRPRGLRHLLALCTPYTSEEILGMGASDFARLVMAMREVNADFFEMFRSQMMYLGKIMKDIPGEFATPEPSTGS